MLHRHLSRPPYATKKCLFTLNLPLTSSLIPSPPLMLFRLRHASARRLPGPLDRLTGLKQDGSFIYSYTRRDSRNAATLKARGKSKRTISSVNAAKTAGVLQVNTPTAEKLDAGEFWNPRVPKGGGAGMQATDIRRVNIVNEKLCGEYIFDLCLADKRQLHGLFG